MSNRSKPTAASVTFSALWAQCCANNAMDHQDTALAMVAAKARGTLKFAGWLDAAGQNVVATTGADMRAAAAVLNRSLVEYKVAAAAKVKATVSASQSATMFLAAKAGVFAPVMAKVGDKCPKCAGQLTPVGLVNNRSGLLCAADRVVLPLARASA